jgi:hypothetical protein
MGSPMIVDIYPGVSGVNIHDLQAALLQAAKLGLGEHNGANVAWVRH